MCELRSRPSGRPDSRCRRADRLRARRGACARDPRGGICARTCTDDPGGCACRGVAWRCQGRARRPPTQGVLDRGIGRTIGASRGAPAQSNPWGEHDRRVHRCRCEPAGRCHRDLRSRRPAKATQARLHDPYGLGTPASRCSPSRTGVSANEGLAPGETGDGGKVLEISVAPDPKALREAI